LRRGLALGQLSTPATRRFSDIRKVPLTSDPALSIGRMHLRRALLLMAVVLLESGLLRQLRG